MLKLAIFVVLCVTLASNALAQDQGKNLIVAPGGIGSDATRLLNAVKPPYQGSVELDTRIPLDLSGIDALMILRPIGDPHAPWLDSLQQDRLINYVKAGGRFYAEGADFRNRADTDDDTTDNQFWDLIGDSSEAMTAMGIHVDSAYGIAGTFAQGVSGAPPYNPLRQDAGGGFHIDGMIPLIGTTGNYGVHLAWRAPDPGIKAVLHWPIIDEHYGAFIARVVCDYFQLCALDVVRQLEAGHTLSFDPTQNLVRIPSPGQIVMTDILGRTIFAQHEASDRFVIPDHIVPGTYILTWDTEEDRSSITLAIR